MRKMIFAAMAMILVLACEPLEEERPDKRTQPQGKVCVNFRATQGTKSSMAFSETDVSNLNVYAYRGGQLESESYVTDDQAELELVRGGEYTIYALANAGEVHAPALESDLATLSLVPTTMVMCFREGVVVTAGSHAGPIELPLTRLFARYILVLDKNLENCDYQISSVEVKQQAAAVRPFAGGSVALATTDGDTATAADLDALNSGQGAVFYIPENCQGVLLPDNSDPWSKIPENIPAAKRSLCTYLHIEGTWTTSGATADLSMNLMLGADNCTDFNVERNASITITLSLTDSGTLRSSWKVDMDNLDDDRVLSFPSSSYSIMQEAGWTQIPLTVSPADMSFTATITGPSVPVMEAKVENGNVYVRGLYDGELRPSSTLTVRSWDGRVSASILLMLNYSYTQFQNYSINPPAFVGEYGYIQLTDASAEDPVLVETGTWSTTMNGDIGDARNYEYHYDAQNHAEYYVLHREGRIYIRYPDKNGGTTYLQMTQHKSRILHYVAPVSNPKLGISNAEVTEGGNRMYDATKSLYYDSIATIYLTDNYGSKIDVNKFRIPDELIPHKQIPPTSRNVFLEFLDLYGSPTAQGGARFGCVNESLIDGDCVDLAADSNLARVYLYGTDSYGTTNPTFAITASLTMSSGDVLTATGLLTGKPAFPSQRYIGSYYNYQVAPGPARKYTTELDFTGGGSYVAPSTYGVSWSIVHINGESRNNPSAAFAAGSADKYSSAASISGSTLNFAEMSSTVYPACGALGLKGVMTNPHTGNSFTGYYTLSLVLYVSFGCSVSFSGNNMEIRYYPFFEYLSLANLTNWSSGFPSGLKVTSAYNSSAYAIWNTNLFGEDVLTIPGVSYPGNKQDLIDLLYSDMSRLRFTFRLNGSNYNYLLLDSSATSMSGQGGWNVNGSKGYYRLVRQYDLGNLDDYNYDGLENYILEAAYDTF